jgi:hypothetical protein
MSIILSLSDLIVRARSDKRIWQGRILALDPGETTGLAFFDTTDPGWAGAIDQVKTWPIDHGIRNLGILLDEMKPNYVVYESYNVYSWKADQHKGSSVPTIQVIGIIQTLCVQRNIPFSSQTPQNAKTFCTDDKLKAWGLWTPGKKHGRDATRHACFWLLFNAPTQSTGI